jgi:hypothetical protein
MRYPRLWIDPEEPSANKKADHEGSAFYSGTVIRSFSAGVTGVSSLSRIVKSIR